MRTEPSRLEFGEGVPGIDWRVMPDGPEKYAAYLCSREWAVKRNAVFKRCSCVCERCGVSGADHVHHLTYARKYSEQLEDLQALCRYCHDFTHGKSDRDPIVEHAAQYKQDRGLHEAIAFAGQSGADGDGPFECWLACPFCGSQEVHIDSFAELQEDDAQRVENWLRIMVVWCESGHQWEVCFQTRRGRTFAFTRNLRDRSSQ